MGPLNHHNWERPQNVAGGRGNWPTHTTTQGRLAVAVQKRTRNGQVRWVGRYRDPSGKEHSKTFDTRREAKAFVDGALAEAWAKQAPAGGTRDARVALKRNLGPLRDIPADRLPTPLVREWVGMLRDGRPWIKGDNGLGTASVSSLLAQLKAMLNQAVDDNVLPVNPAAKVQSPRPKTAVTFADIPTPEQVRLLEETARGGLTSLQRRQRAIEGTGPVMRKYRRIPARDDLALAIRLGAVTGMRAGEVCGLTWAAVDLEASRLTVVAQAARTGTALREVKTGEGGHRVVTIDAETCGLLERHRRARPFSERVILKANGKPYTATSLAYEVRILREALGLPATVNMKSLRHFHATSLLRAGVPVKTVQARLGHSTATMTLEVYAHFVPSDDERAAAAISAVLAGAGQLRDGALHLRAVDGG